MSVGSSAGKASGRRSRGDVGLVVVLLAAVVGFTSSWSGEVSAAAGTITTVATQISPIGQPLTALQADFNNLYIGHDSSDALYVNLYEFGIGKAAVGANISSILAAPDQYSAINVRPDGSITFSYDGCQILLALADGSGSSSIAGTGVCGSSGDGGAATAAQISAYDGVAAAGGVGFIAEYGRIRKIASGTITTVAGNGTLGDTGDTGLATAAQVDAHDLDVDGSGRLVFINYQGDPASEPSGTIRRLESDNTITTRYTPTAGRYVTSLAAASDGSIYFTEEEVFGSPLYVVKKIAPGGTVTTVAGTGVGGEIGDGDGGAALAAKLGEFGVTVVGVLSDGSVLTSEQSFDSEGLYRSVMRRFTVGGTIDTVLGGGALQSAPSAPPLAVAGSSRLLTPPWMQLSGSPGLTLDTRGEYTMARTPAGDVDVYGNFTGSHTLITGSGSATTSSIGYYPESPVYDRLGNLYYFDGFNYPDCKIYKRTPGGVESVFYGGTCAGANAPQWEGQLAVAPDGSLYNSVDNGFGDSGIIKIPVGGGAPVRIAGKTGCPGGDSSGDGGPAANACLNLIGDLLTDKAGNLFFSDSIRVRRINTFGIVTTVAGDGFVENDGDGGPATSASLNEPYQLAFDAAGNLYISTIGAIRKVESVGVMQPALVPLGAPGRVLDTRNPGGTTVDGLHQAVGRIAAGATYELPVAGRSGVPSNAASVVLNVTVVSPSDGGFVTVYPCGEPLPNASNLNFAAGQTIPNSVLTRVGAGGKVCLFSSAATDLLVDVAAFFLTSDALVPLGAPGRVLDSRNPGGTTIDGLHQAVGRIAAGGTYELPVAGRAGVPANAASVVLNVTVVSPSEAGFVSVYPCGEPLPNASNLNFADGQTIPNSVIARGGAGGKVCLFSSAATDLLVDVAGYFLTSDFFVPLAAPGRLMDTRFPGGTTIDGFFQAVGRITAGGTYQLPVAGRAGVPSNAASVVLNVTVVSPSEGGFVTVYPCGEPLPNASNLNFAAGQTIPNSVIARVGTGGKICLFSSEAADLLVDVSGYFQGS
ncbi:MAG: hypothetical protein K8R99_03645 [Actinomycetia bacterium]|nr:hypothetical protein [Actinomycetes bacterium]